MHKIYVIIVTYNGTKWIDRCFGSLINSLIPVEIIAIDNNSTDGTTKEIKEKFPQVNVIETGQNLGFGKANNIGLRMALANNADYTFLFNQDACIEPDSVKQLVEIHKQNPKYDLLSPLQLNGKGSAIDRNFQNYLSPAVTPEFLSDATLGQIKDVYESKYANAAAWFLTQKAIKTVGGFDPLFKHYGEDDDYIHRFHKKGLKLGIVTTSRIYHDRPQNGMMHNKFYENLAHIKGILSLKTTPQPRIHFLLRRIISNYFVLYFNYFGSNNHLKHLIKIDKIALKLRKRVGKSIQNEEKGSAHL